MPRFDTFSCWIQVDGLPLPEYKVEFTPDGEGITCWIPSTAGKAFQVYFSDSERVLTTSTTIIVDGQHCGGQAIFSRYDSPYYPGVVVQSGAAVSEMTVRPFIFSQCMLVDDDYYLDRPSNVGQISVAIDEVRIHGFTQSKSFALSPPVVHERAKKGIVHGVQLGPQLIERRATVRSTPVRRITTFIFNYRLIGYLLDRFRNGQGKFSRRRLVSNCRPNARCFKQFQIKYSDSLRTRTTASTAIIDGVDCRGKILYSRSARPNQSSNFVIQKGVRASSMSRRALVFSKCQLVEDDKDTRTRGPPSTGEIKVFIDEVEVLQRSRKSKSVVLPSLQMSEKAKKGRVHGVKLGNTVALLSVPRKIHSVRRLCTFVFYYRPLEILMADGIILTTKSPKKSIGTSAKDFLDLTLEDKDDPASKTQGKLQSSMVSTQYHISCFLLLISTPLRLRTRPPQLRGLNYLQIQSLTSLSNWFYASRRVDVIIRPVTMRVTPSTHCSFNNQPLSFGLNAHQATVMPALASFSCSILVQGQPLPEYKVELSPDGQCVSCWIPSEAGKEFHIRYVDSIRALTTGTTTIIDGTKCSGKIIYSKAAKPRKKSHSATQIGIRASRGSRRALVFSNCELVEDDDGLHNTGHSIGQIQVVVDEIEVGHDCKMKKDIALPSLRINERAKKGVVHGVALGKEMPRHKAPRRTRNLRRLASFVFNYRPLAVLIAEGIVPSQTTNLKKDVTSGPDFIDLTSEDDVKYTLDAAHTGSNVRVQRRKIRLGDEVKRAAKKPSRTTRLRKLATFIFMYRPLGILLAMGIAPSPVGSDGSSAENAVDITQQDGDDSPLEPRDHIQSEQGEDEKQVLVRNFMVSKDFKFEHDVHAKEEGIDAKVSKLEERLIELRAVKMEGVDIESKERQRGFGMAQSKGGSLRSPIDIPDYMVKVEGAP
ncbi:hypothetical protein CVT26_008864 [Gymnopilus dilepis]|uniref:DUF7918 domain-containing protein n=1 Tax=Gymnopilus dilepis TaxID=231916 RepID=A0A409WUG9_9AGAR|nr:hypothetical protein CVT26_008864 [Gymnopilus dilepis]